MTVGILFVVLLYLAGMYGPIRSLARLGQVLGRGEASRHRLSQLLAGGEVVRERPDAPALPAPSREISLRSVSFAYAPGRQALHGVDLQIPVGSTVCIVGPTGAGKSTLLSLLLRLYDPDLGLVAIDGADLRSFDLRSVRKLMALVPQEPEILDGTLLQNIASGSGGASEAELLEAARLALLDDLALRLPRGLHTEVGEGGRMLSFGQRRCLAIARALARRAPVMLMDEPTSGLDAESEGRVMSAIRRAGWSRTVVIATHRLALAAQADRVVVLCGGRVAEQGTPAELLHAGGQYARLWKLQLPADFPRRVETQLVHANGFAAAAANGSPVHH
jgi:subfamily B ATP-binding cassette protein MsbA